jgi:hypothetical protein
MHQVGHFLYRLQSTGYNFLDFHFSRIGSKFPPRKSFELANSSKALKVKHKVSDRQKPELSGKIVPI